MKRERGLILLATLIVVAIIGMVAASSLQAGAQLTRRDAEEELLHQGRLFQQALMSYVDSTPGVAVLGPRSIDELLRDQRFPGVVRHLRRLPADPLTGRFEWGLQRSPDGQIVGIYSLAPGVPIKRTGFEAEFARLNDAASYQDWIFGPSFVIAPAAARGAR